MDGMEIQVECFTSEMLKLRLKSSSETTYEAMMRGIEMVKTWEHYRRYWSRNSKFCRKKNYSVVRDFCGHGLGKVHDQPSIQFW